ncbi:hypothetical protein GALL_541970 [mine drainage metagenome]|uniref:Uncharacterized protein n=1 Tax=mine drainage metagenome TaxID=410659 RepID=A0A1J5PL44_9ZZZZ
MTYMEHLKPVTKDENRSVRGLALVHDIMFQQILERAEELRKRQAAYVESLPRDPRAAARAALVELRAATDGYPSDLDTIINSLNALTAICGSDDAGHEAEFQTAHFLSSIATDAALKLKRHLDRIDVILRTLDADDAEATASGSADQDAQLHDLYRQWVRLGEAIQSGAFPERSEEMRAATRGMVELEAEIGRLTPMTARGWAERVALVASLGLGYDPHDPEDVFADLFRAAKSALNDPE